MDYVEMRDFLKSQNKTDEDMQKMWDYCISKAHPLICQLANSGKSWTDMNMSALKKLEREYNKIKTTYKGAY